MTLPDQHLPGQFIHSIRRTSGRTFFLRPGARTNWTFRYAYALAVEESGVMPSAELVMSNHRHGGLLDRYGTRSVFHEILHGLVGQVMNDVLHRRGNYFWDNQGPTGIICLMKDDTVEYDDDDEVDKELESLFDDLGLDMQDRVLLYIWMNPVKANLVERLKDWPGFKITPDDWGRELDPYRPPWVDDGYPPQAKCTPMPPKKWDGRLEEARRYYKGLIRTCEDFYRKRRKKQRKGVLGRKGALRQDPFTRPKTPARYRRRRKPRFCGSSKLRKKAIAAYAVWLRNYEIARRKFRNGDRDILFPAGTVRLRRIAGVRCRGGPRPEENPMP